MSLNKVKNSITARLIIIAIMTIVLLIPAILIQNLVEERQERRVETEIEISDKWGASQTISGPIVVVPILEQIKTDKTNKTIHYRNYAYFLPDDLQIEGKMDPQIRYRGIYEVALYSSLLQFNGSFKIKKDLDAVNSYGKVLWDQAFLAIGLSDMQGINDLVKVKWADQNKTSIPGIEAKELFQSGVNIPIDLSDNKSNYDFSFALNINGSKQLFFSPLGKETNIKLESSWNNPSFSGAFLPKKREVTESGFSATWKILNLNRNYPQLWIGNQYKIENSAFGVELRLPVDEYQKTMRTTKYAIMFIALTFLTFFMIEVLNKKMLHPIQYLLIGFALLLFYTLLLSFSEHIGFQSSYIIATISITGLITSYSKSILGKPIQMFTVLGTLTGLYSYLFIILQLQDYALIMGSIGLFFILAIVMFVTRKINWYSAIEIKQVSKV
ncbi:MAG: cell envelope integrity protein CreD [Calditrichaeota bacterium]|nr:MAG: cell envelope integrity protein CreD [Calditrichota bacterium]MBL1207904.1 cell envelope integrity protein CreD [Calditrichota bacterium]NOG47739.1 cell envelope integrity protein CreD [Calditrichota bacterium]